LNQLRIVFASGKPLFPIGEGGGETVAYDLLSGLAGSGCSVEALGQATFEELPRLNNALCTLGRNLSVEQEPGLITSFTGQAIEYPTKARFTYDLGFPTTLGTPNTFIADVDHRLAGGTCDLLLFQAERSPELLAVARSRGIYPLFYAHNGLELQGFQYPQELPMVITSSTFSRDRILAEYDLHTEVLYPAVDLERYRAREKTNEYITMVNPVAAKGIASFLKLAAALPDRKFLVVEGWGTPPAIIEFIRTRLPNVTYMGRQIDMRTVYGKTDILVVPSQWESFGRVITEAQINGIPVLASKVGGIPEALGDGGVLVEEIADPQAWLKGLSEVESRYEELSAKAILNAGKFSVTAAVARFREILKSAPGFTGGR
jgi:glycosyltransferase involved in cell wall biosynthesis